MFVVEALYQFSYLTLQQQQQNKENSQKDSQNQQKVNSKQQNEQRWMQTKNNQQLNKRQRSRSQQNQLLKLGEENVLENQKKQQQLNLNQKNQENSEKQQISEIKYLAFEKGDKILVIQAYDNGWWYGNTLKQQEVKGFFPSNYVQVATKTKPPPPPPPSSGSQQDQQENDSKVYDDKDEQKEDNIDWVQNQLKNLTQGPVQSSYYQGIKGFKNVKIDQKNQNILKGAHVKFDVNTGLAKVPIKDQAPAAKAVRQMGYYFDYHQWIQGRNKNPNQKARPNAKRKKIKKLNLKGMN